MLENVLRDLLKVRLIEVLENDENGVDKVLSIIGEINSYNNELDYFDYQENDDYFFNTYFENNPAEAVRACYFGNYNYNDKYVKFNVYGNLETACHFELVHDFKCYIDDIIDKIIMLKDDIYFNDTLQDIINEYEEIKEIHDTINDKIDEGFESNTECILDDFNNVLTHINDGFNIDVNFNFVGDSILSYRFILTLSYEDDDIEVIYILNFEDDDKNNITFLEIEDVKINEI